MLATVSLALALSTQPDFRAVLHKDSIKVIANGSSITLKKQAADNGCADNPLLQQLTYRGDLYLGKDYSIRNISMRDELRLPGVNRVVGGLPTKRGLLWIYVFHQVDYQEMVDSTKVFLVGTEDGKLELRKTIYLQGLTGGMWFVSAIRFDNKLFLYFPHVLTASGKTPAGLLDLDTLVYKDLGMHNISISQFGGVCSTGPSQISFLNTVSGKWMQVRLPATKDHLGLVANYTIGKDTLLSYQGTFNLEPAGILYTMPKKADYEDCEVWTDGNLYIGLTWKEQNSSKKSGALLDAKTLKRLCSIVVKG